MSKELARAALNNPADLEAFFALCNARGEVDAQITGWLEEQLDRLAGNLGLERVNRLTNFRQRYAGFAFRNPALRQHHLQIRFEFQYGNGGGFAFGFVYEDPSQPGSFADELRRLFAEHFGKPQISAAWPAWTMWKGYETWNDALLVEIRFGGKFLQDLEERLKILTAIATQLNSESA
jgi:hypothetical protein